MLIIADFVRPLIRTRCLRSKAFIAAASDVSYCVAPRNAQCPDERGLVVRYDSQRFEQYGYAADFQLPVRDGTVLLQSYLSESVFLLSFLADQPQWIERLHAVDPQADDEVVVRSFGIDPDVTCRPSIGGWAEGSFLAPDAGGYAFFYVDTGGQVSIRSRSATVLPVAFHLAADREAERVDLAARLGKTPPAPDDLRP